MRANAVPGDAVKQLRRRKIVLRTCGRSEGGAQQCNEGNAVKWCMVYLGLLDAHYW
jgi:hypothetical protein